MADADEDVIPTGGKGGEDVDLSDETQDFRFLTSISREDATIPKRGEKDFEPHATALQSNTLAASRQAMHNALSYQRIHAPKGHTIATYYPPDNMAYAQNPRGTLFQKMGHVRPAGDDPLEEDGLRGQRLWLLPEEVLYLLERGTLDVRWPPLGDEDDPRGLPMSLQGAYAVFIGDEASHNGALTFERFSVYASLKRMGYTVMRAPSWDSPGPPPDQKCYPPPMRPQRTWQLGLFTPASLWSRIFAVSKRNDNRDEQSGPLVQPALYRDYNTIYQRLAQVPYHDPLTIAPPPSAQTPTTDPNFRITFHVWKPGSTTFKKSAPGEPDFRIAIINARETSAPTLEQLSTLLETTPFDPPKDAAAMYTKLKHGYKNVILAVVDQGVTSYLRIADSAFGREKVFATRGGRGGKRGGGGRGRGRGRGR